MDELEKAVSYARKGNIDSFFELIISNPELVNYKDEFESNLLIEIISYADISVIKKLIDMGTDINLLDNEGMTAMHILIENRGSAYLKKIQLLLDSGFDLEIAGFNGWKPLHKAVFHNHYDIVQLLLDNGADINTRTELDNSKTALMIAANKNSFRMVKFLVEFGADFKLKDKYSRTAKDYTISIIGWRIKSYLKLLEQKT